MANPLEDDPAEAEVFYGSCPDPQCQKRLPFFKQFAIIECPNCGQSHHQSELKDVKKLDRPDLLESLANVLAQNAPQLAAKKGADAIKVNGLSNYHCKILSEFLSRYGMEKNGQPKLLTELGRSETFDCSILGSRAFLIEPKHLDVVGFGKDKSGSLDYLRGTLDQIYEFNNGKECLIPIHADGDGHCLVHAISRALVGRELFWHPLRENLRNHFVENQDKYKVLFKDFIDTDEWGLIISECEPNYVPFDGEPLGMRNIHIFGLANVLHRPIILLDSMAGMASLGDYTGVFLPCLVPVEQCQGPDKSLNKPLCIAWSSSGRNHYIPLVALKQEDESLPRLPRRLLPQVWGVDGDNLDRYIEFDDRDSCVIGGDKCLKDSYIQRLASCMDQVFQSNHGVTARDVADVHHYIRKNPVGVDTTTPTQIIDYTRRTLHEHKLYRCINCEAVSEYNIDRDMLTRGGQLYQVAVRDHGPLQVGSQYVFGPPTGVSTEYDEKTDSLIPDWSQSQMSYCPFCQSSSVRRVLADGSVAYCNGDKTKTPSESSQCQCGFKHWWDGREYDNPPKTLPVVLEWSGQTIRDEVLWWDMETDASLNSNVFTTAQQIVQKHFPGEFGSERLVQRVVDSIIAQTRLAPPSGQQANCSTAPDPDAWRDDQSSKIILTGPKKKTFHREELTLSKTERALRERAQQNARLMQKRKTAALAQTSAAQTAKTAENSATPVLPSTTSKVPAPAPPNDGSQPGTSSKPEDGFQSSGSASKDGSAQPTGSGDHKDGSGDKKLGNDERKVGVQTSDGRKGQLTLLPSTTFDQLRAMIEDLFSIPPAQQNIRHGFPPKELAQIFPLPVQHGDKLLVEKLKPVVAPKPARGTPREPVRWTTRSEEIARGNTRTGEINRGKRQTTGAVPDWLRDLKDTTAPTREDSIANWAVFSQNAPPNFAIVDRDLKDLSLSTLLTRLTPENKRLSESGLEKLILALNDRVRGMDIEAVREACSSLHVTLSVSRHLDFWRIVQRHSRLFEPDGMFYRYITNDSQLEHGYTFELPMMPGKQFRYNSADDRCEVWVDPFGYYPVQTDVDSQVTIDEWRSEPSQIGGWSRAAQTFQGQGHSLQGQGQGSWDQQWDSNQSRNLESNQSERMRQSTRNWDSDWGTWSDWSNKGEGRTLSESSKSASAQNLKDISYLTKDSGTYDSQGNFRRIGPGYSIIERPGDEVEERKEQMARVLSGLVDAVKAEVYGDEDEDMDEDDEEEEVVAPTQPKVKHEASRDLARADSAGEEDMDSDGGYS